MVEEIQLDVGPVTTHHTSFIADNILRLGHVQVDYDVRRVINVLKMRGSGHETAMRELTVTDQGPTVLSEPVAHRFGGGPCRLGEG